MERMLTSHHEVIEAMQQERKLRVRTEAERLDAGQRVEALGMEVSRWRNERERLTRELKGRRKGLIARGGPGARKLHNSRSPHSDTANREAMYATVRFGAWIQVSNPGKLSGFSSMVRLPALTSY